MVDVIQQGVHPTCTVLWPIASAVTIAGSLSQKRR
jgi:hypothetical protein